MLDLNLFDNRKKEDKFMSKFINELKNALENRTNKNKEKNVINEYNIFERKKIFLDNRSRKGNELVWIMDDNSVCISENGDGGAISINEVDLPTNAKIGEVYEKVNGKYIYNKNITAELKEIM